MSSRTHKISTKEELKHCKIRLRAIDMYFKEYDLGKHFYEYINAKSKEEEIPEKVDVG